MWKYFSYASYVNYVFRHFEMRRDKQLRSKVLTDLHLQVCATTLESQYCVTTSALLPFFSTIYCHLICFLID